MQEGRLGWRPFFFVCRDSQKASLCVIFVALHGSAIGSSAKCPRAPSRSGFEGYSGPDLLRSSCSSL